VRLSISQITTVTQSFADDLDAYRAAGADGIGIWEMKLADNSLERFRASGLAATTAIPAVPSILPLPLMEGPADPSERVEAIRACIRRLAPFEPSGVLFLVGTALGGNRHRLLATALWLAAAALTVAILRVERSEGAGWFGGTRRRAVSTTVRVGAGLAAAAVIVGVIAGPALPGASSDPLVDTRQGRSSRTTLSPLVDIQARLVNQSDEELFTVASPRPAYWRLTALDDYDLRIWRSSRSYGDASGTLSGGLRDDLGIPLDHTIQITGLDSVWLPTAFAPRSISIPDQVRYDAESGSLLIRRSTLPRVA
jgi:hypothetical protein